jgi:hypothetical protein
MSENETTGINEKQYEEKALALRTKATSVIPVQNQESLNAAASVLREAQGNIKAIKSHMKLVIEEAHRRHKKLTATRKKMCDPFEAVQRDIKNAISEFEREQRIERKRKQREAEEQARQQAEEERLAEAQAAEAAGDNAAASAILEQPEAPVTVKLEEQPKVAGVSYQDRWNAELVSMTELARGAAEGNKLCLACLSFNQSEARRLAVALKDNFNVRGVKAVKTTTVVNRD